MLTVMDDQIQGQVSARWFEYCTDINNNLKTIGIVW